MSDYKTTFVIPTYNRSKELIANYSAFIKQKDADKIRIIVVDGSTSEEDAKANKEFCEKNNFDYYFPRYENQNQNTLHNKAFYGLQKVKTKTAHVADDEDAYCAEGALKCADFLEKNEGYATASGNYKSVFFTPNAIKSFETYMNGSREQENPLARLWSLLYFYKEVVTHSMFKTDVALKAVEKAAEAEITYGGIIAEFVVVSALTLLGKHKRFDINYGIRMNNPEEKIIFGSVEGLLYGPLNVENNVVYRRRGFKIQRPGEKPLRVNADSYVDILRNILLGFIDEPDDTVYDILTIILANYYATAIVANRSLQKLYGDYIRENDFDMELSEQIYKKYFTATNSIISYNYVIDKSIEGSIAIYGAGTLGEFVYKQIKDSHNVVGFIDTDYKMKKEFCGLSVISPKEAANTGADYILIANNIVESKIYDFLIGLKIDERKIIRISDFSKTSPKHSYDDVYALLTLQL